MACNGFAIVSTSIQTLTSVYIRLGQFPHLGNYTLTYWFIINMCGSGDMCVCVRECEIALVGLQWSRGGMVSMPIISLYRVNYSRQCHTVLQTLQSAFWIGSLLQADAWQPLETTIRPRYKRQYLLTNVCDRRCGETHQDETCRWPYYRYHTKT